MRERHITSRWTVLNAVGMLTLILAICSACGGQSATTTTSTNQPQTPIKIGVSVSLSGDFSADGKATEQGYQLWADSVNKSGGLLGRQIKLNFLSDASSTTQVV
ncbi:MAG TPA: ABC transporter substrate-binding protein, partial [Ktedonobacteraceae bacterium]|nr:ABC transporter substrate-binding protein [Ktedonobacteraceae bacterium]